MSTTLKAASERTPAALTAGDYKAVETLLAEMRWQNRLGNSLVTWKNSHALFNAIQRNFRLPASKNERDAHIACIRALKTSGDKLLAAMGEQAAEICANAEFSLDNFTACLEMLDMAREGIELEDDPETLAKLTAIFGAQ